VGASARQLREYNRTDRSLAAQHVIQSAMPRHLHITVLCLVWAAGPAAAKQPSRAELDFFEKRIRPVLVRHCYKCHSAKAKSLKGGLRVDSRQGLLAGGESGAAVVPKNAKASWLIRALQHDTYKMPPKGKLPDKVIKDFQLWVAGGAAMPTGSNQLDSKRKIDIQAARSFWSFKPLKRPALPRLAGDVWSRSNVDRFIWKRLRQAKIPLRPARDADRINIVRRLYFDLLGLPPSPSDVQVFISDRRPSALARLVDRLLASPGFGERWGRHWLDVARYAESVGGGRTKIYQDAWRYRDYVLSSMNRDKPFNRFLMEQIAGDLLPYQGPASRAEQLTATGFLLLGPINYELQDKILLRMEVVDEQLDTIGRSMLGMTIGCARCHDHKFDPIPTADYYAMAGIFRSTHSLTPGNVSGFLKRPLPEPAHLQVNRSTFAKRQKLLSARIRQLRTKLGQQDGSALIRRGTLAGIVLDDRQAEVHGDWLNSTSAPKFMGRGYLHDRSSDKGQKWLTYRPKITSAGKYEIRVSYSAAANRSPNALFLVSTASGSKRIRIDQRRRPPIAAAFKSLGVFSLRSGTENTVMISNEGTTGFVIADAVQFILQSKLATAKPAIKQTVQGKQKKQMRKQLAKLTSQLARLKKTAPTARSLAMAVEDAKDAGDFHVCVRGDIHTLGKKVKRGFLSVVTAAKPAIKNNGSGRLEFAQWLGSSKMPNPLVARVIANRVWQHLMGHGIVRTPDNFGVMGERPSHPELLDLLATELIRRDWSIKDLVRTIVLSRSYQIATHHPKSQQQDPDNRLFARRNRRRLDAESIRDAILTVSGQLSRRRGGPSVKPGTKNEFGYIFASRRRSVYVPSFRNQLDDLLQAFDVADPNLVVGKRTVSTLPTQALFLLNSPFVHQQAEVAAKRILRANLGTPEALKLAYRLSVGRDPTTAEQRICLKFIQNELRQGSSLIRAWSGIFRSLYSCLDFRYME